MAKSKKDILKLGLGLSAHHKKKLERLKERAIEQQAKEAADKTKEQIAPGEKLSPQQMWLPVAPMPTDMCRVSPFFPLARQAIGQRDFIRNMVITSSSWGEILYNGPKLTTYEEDCLNAVLAILNEVAKRKKTKKEDRATYTYQGPMRPILKLVNPNTKKYSVKAYKQVLSALELMLSSVIKMHIKKRSIKDSRKIQIIEMTNLLSQAKWDEDKKELTVTVNPFFYENFARGSVTLLDVKQRAELRSSIAKSLYRFIMSHQGNVWEGHFLTLAASLNMNLEQPQKTTKKRIKQTIKRLVGHNLLETGSSIARNSDVVKLIRTQSAKQRRLKSDTCNESPIYV